VHDGYVILDRNNFNVDVYTPQSDPFPDQVESLRNKVLGIMAFDQSPRIKIKNGLFKTKMNHFLDIIRKLDKITFVLKYFSRERIAVHNKLFEQVMSDSNSGFIMHLNVLSSNSKAPKFMTYEENGFCPIVPTFKNSSSERALVIQFENVSKKMSTLKHKI
jgi:hypothetical protein